MRRPNRSIGLRRTTSLHRALRCEWLESRCLLAILSEVASGGWISDLTLAAPTTEDPNPMVGDSFTRAAYAITTFTDTSGGQTASTAYAQAGGGNIFKILPDSVSCFSRAC